MLTPSYHVQGMSVWRHLRAIALLPVMTAVVIPAIVLYLTREVHPGWGLPRPLNLLLGGVGAALIAGGVALFVWTVRLFSSFGRGTLAPWDPTSELVARGPYRHVRNPMISAVVAVILGEALLLGSWPLLGWAGLFATTNAVYMPLIEEPGLERRFGDDYRRYKRAVPRWLPRWIPWRG
jgi:protein-S-isoprenylcysteine O-methyltransferase Ste14